MVEQGADEAARIRLDEARPVEDEARLVMAWRNDPVTLAASENQEPGATKTQSH